MMNNQLYKIKENVTLANKLSGATIRGNVIKEDEIDGKAFWVVVVPPRTAPLRYAKDAWSIQKGKK
jgi:hypothetical protein